MGPGAADISEIVYEIRDAFPPLQLRLSENLAHLSREPVFQRELIRGLSQEDTGFSIEATAGFQPPQQFLGTLHVRTEGNHRRYRPFRCG